MNKLGTIWQIDSTQIKCMCEHDDREDGVEATTDLLVVLFELLDGKDDAAVASRSEEGVVDRAEPTLTELERVAEFIGGPAELVQVEHTQQ
jgi:hypothetical protein